MAKRIFLADPALKDHRGHHFNLTTSMAAALEAEGHKVICLVNAAFTPIPELRTVRLFTEDTYDAHRRRNIPTAKHPAADEDRNAEAASGTHGFRAKVLQLYRRLPVAIRSRSTPAAHHLLRRLQTSRQAFERMQTEQSQAPAPQSPEVQLYRALRDHGLNGEDVVFFNTSDAHTYRDIVNLFFDVVPPTKWNDLPVFHLSTPYDEAVMPHNRFNPDLSCSIRRLQTVGLLDTRVFLHAENNLLAEHLSQTLSVDVRALPIPVGDVAPRLKTATCRIVALGPARTEKGFPQLPAIVSKVLSEEPRLPVEFVVQITPQILGYTDDVAEAVSKLESIDDERLILIHEPLSRTEYLDIFGSADGVMMLYDLERYRVRGSGIAVEAVLLECIIIATQDTVPSYLGGAAGLTLSHENRPEEAADLIRKLVTDLPTYRNLAREIREKYQAQESNTQFAAKLCREGMQIEQVADPAELRYHDTTIWRPLL